MSIWDDMSVLDPIVATTPYSEANDIAWAADSAICAGVAGELVVPSNGSGNHWTFISDLITNTPGDEFNSAPGGTPPFYQGFARFMAVTADGLTGYMDVNQDQRGPAPFVSDSIVAVDIATMTEGPPLFVGWWAYSLALSPDEQTLCVVTDGPAGGYPFGPFTISKIDIGSWTITATYSIGTTGHGGPSRAVFTPDSATVIVTWPTEIYVLDVATWTPNYIASPPTLPTAVFRCMGPVALTSGGSRAWIMWNSGGGGGSPLDAYAVPLDVSANTWGTEVLVDSGFDQERTVGSAIDILLSSDGVHLYAVGDGDESGEAWWRVISITDGSVLKEVELGFTISFWFGHAFVYETDTSHYVRGAYDGGFNPSGFTKLTHIGIPPPAQGVSMYWRT